MSYYDSLDEDIRRAEEILAARSLALQQGTGTSVPHADTAYKLLESFVAAIESLRLNEKMLAAVFRNTVVALADVPDDWTGTVKEGRELINANVRRVADEMARLQAALAEERARRGETLRAEIGRLREQLAVEQEEWRENAVRRLTLIDEQAAEIARLQEVVTHHTVYIDELRAVIASHEEELGDLQPKYIAAVNERAALREQLAAAEQREINQATRLVELHAEIETVRREKRQQFAQLLAIRTLADEATGTDRTQGDPRESGALGAVKLLIARLRAATGHE